MIPELGAKIVSITYKPTQKEWLIPSGPRKLRRVAYGSAYAQADLSGWDECFPSILACSYPEAGAYYETSIPDHGDLWSIPWKAVASLKKVQCSVNGLALPYSFSRTVTLIDEQTFRFHYEAYNVGEEALAVFWTAHPLFAVSEQTEMIFPEGTTEVLCVDGGKRLQTGRIYAWPDGEGELPYPINRIGSALSADSRKFYRENVVEVGRCGLIERGTGEKIELLWSPEQLPYFGAWINEGALMEVPVCALEPCNGYYDNLALAHKQNKLMRIQAGETVQWHLDVKLSCEKGTIV